MVDDYLEHNRQNMLEKAFLSLMQSQPGYASENAVALLAENGALQNYAIAYLVMDFSAVSGWKDFSPEERAKTFEWVRELCREVAQNTFPENALFSANTPAQSQTLFLLCWQLEKDTWKSRLRIFAEKAGAACRTIAKTELSVMGTSCFAGPESLESCRRQLFGLRENYYYFGSNAMFYEDFAPVKWGGLALGGIGDRLQTEINAKNAAACELLLKRAIDRVSTVPHQQSQALWLCGGIYSAVAAFLEIDTAKGRQSIEQLATRQQVLEWLELIKTELSARMGQCDPVGRTALPGCYDAEEVLCRFPLKRLRGLDRAGHRGIRCKLQVFPRGKAQQTGQQAKALLLQCTVEPGDGIVVDQAAGIDHPAVAVGCFHAALVGGVCFQGRVALGHNGDVGHGLCKMLLLFQYLRRCGQGTDGGRQQHQLGRKAVGAGQFQQGFQGTEAGRKLQTDLIHGGVDILVQLAETAADIAEPDHGQQNDRNEQKCHRSPSLKK